MLERSSGTRVRRVQDNTCVGSGRGRNALGVGDDCYAFEVKLGS